MLQFSVGKLLAAVALLAVLCAILLAIPANFGLFVLYSIVLLLFPVFVVLAVFGRDSLRAFAIGSATTWLVALGGLDAGPQVWELLERVLSGGIRSGQRMVQAKLIYLMMIGWITVGGLLSLLAYRVAFGGNMGDVKQKDPDGRDA